MIGKSFGRYQIEEVLGEGGMAIVYKAFDSHLETHVALKVIRSDWLLMEGKEPLLMRFEAEAKRVARLSHPNIISVLDYGQHEGTPYLVMKYIPGGTLKDRLGKPIHWQEAARILAPVARALSYAHKQGLIHRDVKPANILLNETGEPLLSDFGLAKILYSEGSRADLTGTSVVLGTPEYMAPEQALGKQIDHRADIYSLGLVFYEMITGRKPFTADTPMAVAMKQITEPLPEPKAFVPNLPAQVEQVLRRALAKNPDDRFPTAVSFHTALEQIISGISGLNLTRQVVIGSADRTVLDNAPPSPPRGSAPVSRPASQPPQSRPPIPQSVATPESYPQIQPARKRISPLLWVGGAAVLVLACLAIVSGAALFTWLPFGKTPTSQVAAATPTQLAEIVYTATPKPLTKTQTNVPTRLPDTPAPDTDATERASNRIARTATALARENTDSSGMSAVITELKQIGVIRNTSGNYQAIDDFNENWAQIGWYQYWNTGLAPTNFVIRAHTEWESASRTADWFNSGCGFTFHETDVENHYMIFLALDGYVYLKAYIDGQFRELGKEFATKVDNIQGSADVILAVEGSRITYFVNGKKVFQRDNNELSDGNLGLTLVSGTNKDYGTRCKMTGVEVWVLGGDN